jgi:hypothetical protein
MPKAIQPDNKIKKTSMEKTIVKGSATNKGIVEKIVYLTFQGATGGIYTDYPMKGGKGLICAKIGNKNYPIGELKLLQP